MKRCLLWLALSLIPLSRAHAYVEGGLDPVFGSYSYSGLSAYAAVGGESGFYLRPRFAYYKSNYSTGTYKSFGARVGYDSSFFSIGVEGGATPKVNGYANVTAGADATFTLTTNGGAKGRLAGPNARGTEGRSAEGLTRVDVGAAVNYTGHREDRPAPDKQLKLGQTDISGFAGVKFFGLRASGQVTKSQYDRDLAGSYAQPNTELVGVRNQVRGFTDLVYNLRLDGTKLLILSPFVSYTYTKFKLNQPNSRAVQVGAAVNLSMLDVRGAYQYYDPGGGAARQNYFTLGASLNF